MDERLPWFRVLPAEQRSWVTLVAQAGISGYVVWATTPRDRSTGSPARSSAPRRGTWCGRSPCGARSNSSGSRSPSPRSSCPRWPPTSRRSVALRDSLLRYSREVAFAAASVYAAAAETRGAWDAGWRPAWSTAIVRGEDFGSLSSRAAALDWDPTGRHRSWWPGRRRPAIGPRRSPPSPNGRQRRAGRRCPGCRAIDWCWCCPAATRPAPEVEALFGDGPVVQGRPGGGLRERRRSRRPMPWPAWTSRPPGPDAPRTGRGRRPAGRAGARRRRQGRGAAPHGDLRPAGRGPPPRCCPRWTPTSSQAARWSRRPGDLFVHPNTVRYRLTADRRVDRTRSHGAQGPAGPADRGDPRAPEFRNLDGLTRSGRAPAVDEDRLAVPAGSVCRIPTNPSSGLGVVQHHASVP